MAIGELINGIKIADGTGEMERHDCLGARRNERSSLHRIERLGGFINVAEDGNGPAPQNCLNIRNVIEGRQDDFIARRNAGEKESQVQCGGTGHGCGDYTIGLKEVLQSVFEGFSGGTHADPADVECIAHGLKRVRTEMRLEDRDQWGLHFVYRSGASAAGVCQSINGNECASRRECCCRRDRGDRCRLPRGRESECSNWQRWRGDRSCL